MAPRRYIALSKEPVNRRAPVKNRFPTDAVWKLKNEEGRVRFRISRFIVLRKERINSSFWEGIFCHIGWVPSTIWCHSSRASEGWEERRWLKKVFIAVVDGELEDEGIRRTRRPGVG